MGDVRVRLRITGRVQGVGFRHAAREAAWECRVGGWVRNLADGSVEIEAQGPRDAVGRLTAWARRGPEGARVESVEEEPRPLDAGSPGFEIRR